MSPEITNPATTVGYTLISVAQITASETFTPAAGASALWVEAIGGGGQGGGTPGTAGSGNGQCAAGAGGGGGAWSAAWITSVAASYTVTIGAGGSTGTAGQAGQAGGDTSFGSTVVAKGGPGGSLGGVDVGVFPDVSGAAVAGGHASAGTGDIKLEGGSSSGGIMFRVGFPQAGQGGTAPRGGGTRLAAPNNGTAAGGSGLQYGGGGSGASATTSASAQIGGSGAQGVVTVWQFRKG